MQPYSRALIKDKQKKWINNRQKRQTLQNLPRAGADILPANINR